MKKTDYKQNLLTGFLVIFVVTLGLSSCGTNEEETNIKQEVRVYNWSDYIADSTIREFEKETGIDVTYDVYDSNEILEGKLLSGNTGYDIVGPSSEFMGRQIIAGVYQKLNKDALYNYDNLDPEMMNLLENLDPDNAHSIPYLWGTTGIGYNKQKAIEIMGADFAMDTLDVVFVPEIIAKFQHCGVAFLDAPSEMFKAALHYLGLNPNSQNPKIIKSNRQNCSKMYALISNTSIHPNTSMILPMEIFAWHLPGLVMFCKQRIEPVNQAMVCKLNTKSPKREH